MQKVLSSWSNMLFTGIALFSIVLSGCNKNAETVTPALPGNEFLTTVELELKNINNPLDTQLAVWTQMSPYSFTYQVDSAYFSKAVLNLKAGSIYAGRVIILDQTQAFPYDTVSNEILARENYHLFFFQPSPVLSSSVDVSDTSTSIPMTYWVTGQPSTDTTYGGISANEVLATAPANALNLSVSRTDMDDNVPPMQIGLKDNFYTGAASTGILRVVLRHQPNAKNGTYPPGSSDLDVTYAVNIQ